MILLDFDRIVPRESWLGRVLRWPLDRLPKDVALPILSGPLVARRWVVGAGIHRCWLGTYERTKQRALKARLEHDMVAYDIGANAGFYSLLMSRLVGETGHVFAFEPLPENLRYFESHLRLNGVRNVTVSGDAIGDNVGEAQFAADRGNYKGCFDAAGSLRVRVQTVDHLVDSGYMPPADLVKIDVEGAELAVLRGGERFLKRFRPTIFLATHGQQIHADCCALLRQCGYRLQTLAGSSKVESVDEIIASTR